MKWSVRVSGENLFSLAREKREDNKRSCLYVDCGTFITVSPGYCTLTDRYQLGNTAGLIENGIFYSQDDYPDSHLYADGDFLRKACHRIFC